MENKKKKIIIFFFKLGIFCLEMGKKHTFWHWEWGRISAPKSGDGEPCTTQRQGNVLLSRIFTFLEVIFIFSLHSERTLHIKKNQTNRRVHTYV